MKINNSKVLQGKAHKAQPVMSITLTFTDFPDLFWVNELCEYFDNLRYGWGDLHGGHSFFKVTLSKGIKELERSCQLEEARSLEDKGTSCDLTSFF